jgi:hypothetical protein
MDLLRQQRREWRDTLLSSLDCLIDESAGVDYLVRLR